MDLNELKNEQIKEDKIEKLIESFQLRVIKITISPKGGKNDTKRINLFNAKFILFTKKLKQYREQTI